MINMTKWSKGMQVMIVYQMAKLKANRKQLQYL